MPGPAPTGDRKPTPAPVRPAPAKTALPGYLVAFIVADVILVALVVWVAFSIFSGGSSDTGAEAADASPSTSSPQASEEAVPPPGDDLVGVSEQVASPSGNILCAVSPAGVRCTIASLAAEPAPVDGCDGTVGYVVELRSGGVTSPCTPADQRPGAAGPDVPVLDYGSSKTVNNFSCESSESGMRCTDASTGKGFVLARAGVSLG